MNLKVLAPKILIPKIIIMKMQARAPAIALMAVMSITVPGLVHILMRFTMVTMALLSLMMLVTVAPMLIAILMMANTSTNKITMDMFICMVTCHAASYKANLGATAPNGLPPRLAPL